MPENYPSASEIVRNLAQIKMVPEVILTSGLFQVVRFPYPYFDGYEYWVVNEKGFLWEPADKLADAEAFLASEEARQYNAESPN